MYLCSLSDKIIGSPEPSDPSIAATDWLPTLGPALNRKFSLARAAQTDGVLGSGAEVTGGLPPKVLSFSSSSDQA